MSHLCRADCSCLARWNSRIIVGPRTTLGGGESEWSRAPNPGGHRQTSPRFYVSRQDVVLSKAKNRMLITSISWCRHSASLSYSKPLQQPSTHLRAHPRRLPSLLHSRSTQRFRGARKLKLTPSYRETGFQRLRTGRVFHTLRQSARSCSGGRWLFPWVRVPLVV
jgi:hypothetical protein